MAIPYPFSITKRKDRPFYYVRFKNKQIGGYMTWRSTGKTDYNEAIEVALKWLVDGIDKKEKKECREDMEFKDIVRKAHVKKEDIEFILEECKRKGLLKSYVIAESKQAIPALDFMLNFWTWEKSPYIAEKLYKKHGIHKRHVKKQYGNIKNHWKPFVKDKAIGEITKQDIKDFMFCLSKTDYSFGVKNDIVRAGTTALKWAYENELLDKDITTGLVFFSGTYKERQILTPELVQAVFSVEWNDDRCKLANMLAMCTGLRLGEIQGLRLQDLGDGRLYIRHSWNLDDGLKCVKNKESRIVQVPFPQLTEALKALGESNPFGEGMAGYIFYATIAGKPIEGCKMLKELRTALKKIGVSSEECKRYTFHGWRHFYIKYMKNKIDNEMLKRQVGHKTLSMLEHYADHRAYNEGLVIDTAVSETFGRLINNAAINFNNKKIYDYIKVEYKGA